ncbi:Serine/threonine protein kinase [Planctomycetales bacterium 10988]|nr:Serine/threonine protein kinase [Planctomycetales bacterium 10988]
MKFTYPSGAKTLPGFTLKRGIGHGGFGEVYFGVSDAGKEVALKLVQRGHEVELRGVSHCLNLRSPDLVELYDIRSTSSGETWVVMEYMPGPTLQTVLDSYPKGLDRSIALPMFLGLLRGVGYLHQQGIVHRDLKPGNIFLCGKASSDTSMAEVLSAESRVKLGDYGLSKFITASRRAGHTESIGTVHYMAPEVSQGRYGKEIDIYALGAIWYEMISGEPPFDGESVAEILMKHLTKQPDLSGLPSPDREVIARCLAKDPEDRFKDTAEMARALNPESSTEDVFYIGPEEDSKQEATKEEATAASSGIYWTDEKSEEPSRHQWRKHQRRQQRREEAAQNAEEAEEVKHAASGRQLPPEPIAQGVASLFKACNGNPLLAIAMVLGIFGMFQILTPRGAFVTLIGGAWLYAIYYVVRYVGLSLTEAYDLPKVGASGHRTHGKRHAHRSRQPNPAQAANHEQPRRDPHFQRVPYRVPTRLRVPRPSERYRRANQLLAEKPKVERLRELTGGMLKGGFLAVALPLFMAGIVQFAFLNQPMELGQLALFAVTALAGVWAVLIPARFWEKQPGFNLRRRFLMAFAGMLVGLVGFSVHQMATPHLPAELPVSEQTIVHQTAYSPQGLEWDDTFEDALEDWDGAVEFSGQSWATLSTNNLLIPYVGFFGSLFFLMRWWMMAFPLRVRSISLGSLFLAGLLGIGLQTVWLLPGMWGPAWAILIALCVQAASPRQPEYLHRADASLREEVNQESAGIKFV